MYNVVKILLRSLLPTRCTSNLSTDSSSDSSSEEIPSTQGTRKWPNSIGERYLDSTKLDLKSPNTAAMHNVPFTDEHVEYLTIDVQHTEALYQLNKRLDLQ